jgi:hypothetical protein
MSNKGNKPSQVPGATPLKPEGIVRGISVGEKSGAVKGSYIPTSEAPVPPAPRPKK